MTTASTTQTAEVLRTAADLIQTRGLYKGAFVDPHRPPETAPFCALGAIDVAAGISRPHYDKTYGRTYLSGVGTTPEPGALAASGVASDLLREEIGGAVAMWNDDRKRTKGEVVNALRRTADRADPPYQRRIRKAWSKLWT